MNIRIIAVAAAGSFVLTACSGGDDYPKADAAADAAREAATTAPSDADTVPNDGAPASPPPIDSALPGSPEGPYPPGRTSHTLPTQSGMTSPATSPPPR